ncbi:hypothetical protein [Trichothermofontia sp.]
MIARWETVGIDTLVSENWRKIIPFMAGLKMDCLNLPPSHQGPAAPPPPQLRYDGHYRCPVCYYGELTGMTLMESFGCSFCRHIFTADLQTQVLRLADGSQALTWRWDGKRWRTSRTANPHLGLALVSLGTALVVLPTVLVTLAVYLFPPLPDTPGAWIPRAWIGLTGLSHLAMVLWLAGESGPFPLYRALRVQSSRLLTLRNPTP